jgi:hypothetical protein
MRALLALGLAAAGCGGGHRPGPPRSTCADAAASIVSGLRRITTADAEQVTALEPRFADACRSSGWRPNVVRCFAIARDVPEQRVCARRLTLAQRDEARLIQGELYAGTARPNRERGGRIDERCRQLGRVLEGLFLCDQLSPFDQMELRRHIELVVSSMATAGDDPRRAAEIAEDCDRLADRIRDTLIRAGC